MWKLLVKDFYKYHKKMGLFGSFTNLKKSRIWQQYGSLRTSWHVSPSEKRFHRCFRYTQQFEGAQVQSL
ncbi:hypothetical protein ILYODFUR_021705 [Ilyodon furcidens]|uniref:Uncharacterized protein n=1 Tax=Ilyodon furcidens TaxID=33524 RepID=A0ABV0TMH1_9TELE